MRFSKLLLACKGLQRALLELLLQAGAITERTFDKLRTALTEQAEVYVKPVEEY